MDPLGAVTLPGQSGLARVTIGGLGTGLALDEPDGPAVGDVHGRQEDQRHTAHPTGRPVGG